MSTSSGFFFELYTGDVQSTWALWVVPVLFLVYLVTAGRRRAAASADPAAHFVWTYSVVFSVETLLDSFATGPLSGWLGLLGTAGGTALMVAFVLIGDFRVLYLVRRLARPRANPLRTAALWTLPVPLFAWALESDLRRRWPTLPAQTIWLVYELGFLALSLFWRTVLVPRWTAGEEAHRAPFLGAVLSYAVAYYALWASADALVMVFGLDAGWALRMIPNQLYYSFFVPFVFWRFFRDEPTRTNLDVTKIRGV
jgi:hypothetical protein